ncbi:PEP-CTERM sorting domain-containing protein [Paludisphaera borealis]|uniref:Ice-binding protein C-terminal domain-containing protein n=1 Tax=Paludisphaera borealis TaxID=1387353 RepID=A0A1U7CPQ1_9BACT|nr:PEP-CTERM sorting domain-containing protein [Paludisphaera borealis]APW60914.1 hypothetical protein BSF38_02407 [Paludisphaera borealis]
MKLHFAPVLRVAAIVAGTVLSSQSAFAGIDVTIEAAGVQSSQQANIITETFNSQATGVLNAPLVTSIGTYTATADSSIILSADQYGGANGTQYISVGSQAGGPGGSMVLSLNGPADYFGLWWSAVDSQNKLQLYSGGVGGTLLGTYTSADLPAFSAGYFGNPNPPADRNTGEPYAYVNFFGTAGTTFDTIVFSNSNATGFESDNHSIHSVPEPSALLMGGAASVIGLAVARRRRRDA